MPRITLPAPLNTADATFEIERLDEDSPIDERMDPEAIQWVRDELERGNDWAWCCVRVVATLGPFKGDTYLGQCAYKSEADFADDGYLPQMKEDALEDLLEAARRQGFTVED